MDIEEIRNICQALPGVLEDIKWKHDLVFSIGGKMFCVVGLDQFPTTASIKVKDEEFEEISNWPNFKPAPYVAKYKWVLSEDITKMRKAEWEKHIEISYNLVKDKLTVKLRKQYNLD